MRTRVTGVLATILLATGAAIAFASLQSAHGPYPGATGAPPLGALPAEFDCSLCHDGNPVNSPGGGIQILGVPAVYFPGQIYPLTVRLNSTATAAAAGRKWGFELGAVRRQDGLAGGTFLLPDPDTLQIVSGETPFSSRNYVEHTFVGTRTGLGGPVEWSVAWQAPDSTDGTILFFCAGNAADGTSGTDGDHIYTTRDSSRARGSVDVPPQGAIASTLGPAQPNPARSTVSLAFTLGTAGPVEASIIDARGRRVRQVLAGWRDSGPGVLRWDGRRDDGSIAPEGVYFARLNVAGNEGPIVRKLTLAR